MEKWTTTPYPTQSAVPLVSPALQSLGHARALAVVNVAWLFANSSEWGNTGEVFQKTRKFNIAKVHLAMADQGIVDHEA